MPEERPSLDSFFEQPQGEKPALESFFQSEQGPTQQQTERYWGDVPLEAVKNIPSSAVEFGKSLLQPVIHPIETATSLKNIGQGVLQHLGIMGGTEAEPYADAVGKMLMDRYGSIDAIKNTIATDPVGLAADVSTVLSGGALAGARAPGLIGTAARTAGTVGRAVDPIAATGKVLSPTIGRAAAEVLGLSTGVGPESVRLAGRAGLEGGEAARAFRENISGIEPTEGAVRDAQGVISGLRRQRSSAYTEGMKGVGEINRPLDFDKIDSALADVTQIKTFKGIPISPRTQQIRQEIGQTVATWRALDPAEYHTPEGLDALKQSIGEIRDSTQFGTPERVVADRAYQGIRQTIIDAAPQYAKVMKGYEEATNQIKILEHELSIPNPKRGNIDTSLRKLQSVLRNNVNASFARRRELAQFLVDNGSPNLLYKLAGQTLQPLAPRGLARLHTMVGAELATLLGATVSHPGVAGLAPLAGVMSPRLVGESAYFGGKGLRPIRGGAGLAGFQAGRLQQTQEGYPFYQQKRGGRTGRVTRTLRYQRSSRD